MLEVTSGLSPQQTAQLAQLHVTCLPETAIGTLGRGYALRVYECLIQSPFERIFLEQQDDRLIGAAVTSEDSVGLFSRLRSQTSLMWHLLTGVPSRQRWRAFRTLTESGCPPQIVLDYPELVFLYIGAAYRRRGIAHKLLVKSESSLRDSGNRHYFVRTRDHPSNQASRFYASQGFTLDMVRDGIQYWIKPI